ncbi:hypothetical protein CCR90_04605 [Rhodovulum sulfidophilum]|uniref:hypothetical protein n=1 Tax=Rhodovulum sulfidophilum TaxID=35806 RepID=UPI00191389A5|nr:hypothetical protein [Rhodovulum sulfidophilum]MBK5923071.1 hypothetical protein [Rhodovulum sulfidophilum]
MYWTHADWSALGNVLSGIGTIVGAIAVIWAARLGSGTFESWREQKISERRIDQAEWILIATYNARRSLGDLRHAAANLFARGSAQRDLQDGAEALTSEAAKAHSYYETFRETASLARRSLADCMPTAKALFDADLEQAIGELMKQFDIVFGDVGWRAELSSDERQAKWKKLTPGVPSEDRNKMNATIAAQVEGICLPQLRAAGRKRRDAGPSV